MKTWKSKAKEIAESMGWSIDEYNDSMNLGIYSPEGQDFNFDAPNKSLRDFREGVSEYAYSYDPEYEASLWYGANRGEPGNLRDLLDDMEWIKERLAELNAEIQKIH
jgi:hypothetical protein